MLSSPYGSLSRNIPWLCLPAIPSPPVHFGGEHLISCNLRRFASYSGGGQPGPDVDLVAWMPFRHEFLSSSPSDHHRASGAAGDPGNSFLVCASSVRVSRRQNGRDPTEAYLRSHPHHLPRVLFSFLDSVPDVCLRRARRRVLVSQSRLSTPLPPFFGLG